MASEPEPLSLEGSAAWVETAAGSTCWLVSVALEVLDTYVLSDEDEVADVEDVLGTYALSVEDEELDVDV